MKNITQKIAYHSYSLVRILFVTNLVFIVIIHLILDENENVPILILYTFWLITGIYIGYIISYFSFKYLNKKNMKDNLPLN